MTDINDQIRIEHIPPSRKGGLDSLRIWHGDEVIYCDELKLAKEKDRQRFAEAVQAKIPGQNLEELETRLLDILSRPVTESATNTTQEELNTENIVRPELFFTTDVAGLTIPKTHRSDDGVTGMWTSYIRCADGTRLQQPLTYQIGLTDEQVLHVFPLPPAPAPGTSPMWSRTSREAWLENETHIDPTDLLEQILRQLAYFIEFPKTDRNGINLTIALWTILTYIYPTFDSIPYLYFGGALGSGKSRVFEVLNEMVFRPLQSSSLSAPALFRTLNDRGGTLLLDEAERLKDSGPDMAELRTMLLAGYQSGGRATRLEKVGDRFITREFHVFGPKALACIAGLPPALVSRCIPITMLRANKKSPKPRRRLNERTIELQSIRDSLHIMALEHCDVWLKLASNHAVCPEMSGRNYDKWQPLLSLASWLDELGANGVLALMQDHALKTNDDNEINSVPHADAILLRMLARRIRNGDRPTATQILDDAKVEDSSFFSNWSNTAVSKTLKRYGLATKKSGNRLFREDTLYELIRIQADYGIDLGIEDARKAPEPTLEYAPNPSEPSN